MARTPKKPEECTQPAPSAPAVSGPRRTSDGRCRAGLKHPASHLPGRQITRLPMDQTFAGCACAQRTHYRELRLVNPSRIPQFRGTRTRVELGAMTTSQRTITRAREAYQMSQKLTKDEQDRIKLHRKIARTIPTKRQPRSLEGQTYFKFNDSVREHTSAHSTHLLPLAASPVLSSGLPCTMAQV